jgi:hypothetical protein
MIGGHTSAFVAGDSFRCSVPRPRDAMGILPQPAGLLAVANSTSTASGARGCARWRRYREALPTRIVMQDKTQLIRNV